MGCRGKAEITQSRASGCCPITTVDEKGLSQTDEFRNWVAAKVQIDAANVLEKDECETAYKAQPFLNRYSTEKSWGDAFGLAMSYALTISGALTTAFVFLLKRNHEKLTANVVSTEPEIKVTELQI